MGCCQAKPTSPAQQKSAFSDYTKRNEHHGGDSNYTLSSVNKGLKNSVKYYSTRVKSSPSQDGNYTIEAVRVDTNSTDHQRLHAAELAQFNTQNKVNNPATLPSAHPKPFEKHTFKSTLSPNDASPKPPTKLNNENNINNNTINLANEREVSVSKSRSRQFRPRSEPTDRSPETANGNGSAPPNIKKEISSDPPPINDEDEDDFGSSSSGDEEIPGLKEIVLSDDEEDDDEDEEDDANLQLMQFLVAQENERLAREIKRMKTTVIEQENKKLKQEAYDEIELEAKSNNDTNEEDKKTKALLRYEKKQKQRMKEKEQAKERRRLKKVEKKKKLKAKLLKKRMLKRQAERVKKRDELREKRKKELEAYNVEESRPTRQQIIQMFDKYFYKPFDSKRGIYSKARKKKVTLSESSSDSSTSSEEEEELGEKGINFDGFMAGISVLGIATILSKSEVEQLFDHMTISSREYGINAVDFCHFLKQNTIVLDPKIATIQRKVISMLAKQQDKEEGILKEQSIDGGTKYDEIEDITTNEVDDLRKLVIQISEPIIYDTPDTPDTPNTPNTPKHSVADIITPETPKNETGNNDFEDEEEHRRERAASISMSESMSVSVSASQSMKIPSNVPRKSFKKINYNWNDSISQKSFNNYKKIREKFGMRYHRHSKNKTKDFELNKAHEKIFSDKLDHLINNDVMLDNDNNDLPPPSQPVPAQEDKPAAADKQAHDNKENKIPEIHVPSKVLVNNASQSSGSSSAKLKIVLSGIDECKEDADEHDFDGLSEKRSAVKSLQRITEYKGNEEMNSLRTLYKQQFKMKQKLERLRKRSLLNFPEPAKPENVEHLMDDRTKYICQELKQCICKNTRYTGLANFGPNGELGIEIEFTSDCDENGYIVGKRVIHFKGMKQALGTGRIWIDVLWNGHKFVPCTKFEWMDEGDGVTTKFWFDSVKSEIDVDHSFFQGKCIRYPTNLDPKKKTTKLIMHEGYFDFVCVSARRRSLRRNSLLQYHTLDINEMTENELEKVPKYVRRMSAYTEKIDQLYEADVQTTRETLFGDAISTVAAINEVDPVTSDISLPEQINE